MERISLKQWIKNFNNGEYESEDFKTQCEAGWYDWFCKDTSLKNKTYKMGNIIKHITNENLLNNCYIFFKNNCPVVGPLYDDFRICSLETGNVLYTIVIGDRREETTYVVYGRENDFTSALFKTNKSNLLINWINNIA